MACPPLTWSIPKTELNSQCVHLKTGCVVLKYCRNIVLWEKKQKFDIYLIKTINSGLKHNVSVALMTLKIELMFTVVTFLYKPLERSLWQKHLTKTSSHTECPRPQLFYISDRDGDPSWTNWTSSSFTAAEHQPVDLESAVCPCYGMREIFQYSLFKVL